MAGAVGRLIVRQGALLAGATAGSRDQRIGGLGGTESCLSRVPASMFRPLLGGWFID